MSGEQSNRCTFIRELKVSDVDAILTIEKTAHSHPWTLKNFIDSLNANNQAWIVEYQSPQEHEVKPQIAAYTILSSGGGEAEILNITVAPAFQRQGIGRMLMQYSMSQLNTEVDTVFLEVRTSNTAAITLYHSLGFNEVGQRPNYYPLKTHNSRHQSSYEDALIFAKLLAHSHVFTHYPETSSR